MRTMHVVVALSLGLASLVALAQPSGRTVQGGPLVSLNSGLCAEIEYNANRDGINVQQGDCRAGRGDWNLVDVGNGEVAIVNRATRKVLDVQGGNTGNGTNVQQYGWNGSGAQRWRIENQGGGFRLINTASGKCLDVESASRDPGANIQIWDCHGRDNQTWRMSGAGAPGNTIGDRGFGRPGDSGYGAPPVIAPAGPAVRPQGRTLYSGLIHSRATGKCVDVERAGTADGVDIRQWSCNGTSAQMFDVVDVGRGEVAFIAQNSGKVMEVTGDTRRTGADVVQRSWNGAPNQRWRMEQTERGYMRVINVASNKCLDLEAARGEDGTNILQSDCHGGQNQQWRMEIRGTGAGWGGYRPRDNNWWGANRPYYEEPPAYLVGDFKSTSGYYGSNVELSIYSDGVVSAKIDGNQRITGYFRDGQLFLGNYRYDVEQERTGFRVTPSGQSGNSVSYQRVRYESPRGGR
ncbi:MAG TPA: RICIN domain-containing protein [Usitatibacteraceae bacterium]|nr:RICIN domain-containing protein [Usitatibacteraceae bacterium]